MYSEGSAEVVVVRGEIDLATADAVRADLRVASERAEAVGHFVEDGSMAGSRHVLFEPRGPPAGRAPDRAGIGRNLARHHFQEAGFPRAVAPDERDALPGLDPQVSRFEERQMSVRERDGVERHERHRR